MFIPSKLQADILEYIASYLDRFPKISLACFVEFTRALQALRAGKVLDGPYQYLADVQEIVNAPSELLDPAYHSEENFTIVRQLVQRSIEHKIIELSELSRDDQLQQIADYQAEQQRVRVKQVEMALHRPPQFGEDRFVDGITNPLQAATEASLGSGYSVMLAQLQSIGFSKEVLNTVDSYKKSLFIRYSYAVTQMAYMGFSIEEICSIEDRELKLMLEDPDALFQLIELGFLPGNMMQIESDALFHMLVNIEILPSIIQMGFSVVALSAFDEFRLETMLENAEAIGRLRKWRFSVDTISGWDADVLLDVVRQIEDVAYLLQYGLAVDRVEETQLIILLYRVETVKELIERGFSLGSIMAWGDASCCYWFGRMHMLDSLLQHGFTPKIIGQCDVDKLQSIAAHPVEVEALVEAGFTPSTMVMGNYTQLLGLLSDPTSAIHLLTVCEMSECEIMALSSEERSARCEYYPSCRF